MQVNDGADYNEAQTHELKRADAIEKIEPLDLTNLPIVSDVPNIDTVDNDTYIKVRRNGFGGSDSSVVLGVNPFKTKEQLIQEKISDTISEEERAISEKAAVKKGKDLEPLIIAKFQKLFQVPTIKPSDMYRFKDYPYLTMNFDGVAKMDNSGYIPTEIKVVTMYGEKHYDFQKAIYCELDGFRPLPENVSARNWDIIGKSAHYGIPPYYYTQLQQEMMALNAPYGYLSVLADRLWVMYTFLIYKDEMVQNELIVQGYKLWNIIQEAKAKNVKTILEDKHENAVVDYMKEHHVNWAEASNATPIIQPEFVTIKEKPTNY